MNESVARPKASFINNHESPAQNTSAAEMPDPSLLGRARARVEADTAVLGSLLPRLALPIALISGACLAGYFYLKRRKTEGWDTNYYTLENEELGRSSL